MCGAGRLLAVSAILAMGACSEEQASPAPNRALLASASTPKVAEGLGERWVAVEVSSEHSSPDGPIVNRVYYGQKFTVYEQQGDWYRTVEDGFTPRWTKVSDLSPTQPPEKPQYAGPAAYRDARIVPGAIPNPGQYGLTTRDVDTFWKGAKLTLQREAGCSQITMADKSVRKPNTYYVTCRNGGVPQNVFFTGANVHAGAVR